MRTLEEEGSKRAARVNKVLDNYSKMISTILIGNNIVNLTASSLATTLAMRINLAVGIATGVLTIVVLLCSAAKSYPRPGQYCILRSWP